MKHVILTIEAGLLLAIFTGPVLSQEEGDRHGRRSDSGQSVAPASANEEGRSGKTLSVGIGFAETSVPLRGGIGAGLQVLPDYEGAKDYSATGLPLVVAEKPGAVYLESGDININHGRASAALSLFHLTYSDVSRRRVQLLLGPMVRLYPGRDENVHENLEGLGDIDTSVSLGAFTKLTAGAWLFELAATAPESGDGLEGRLYTFEMKYSGENRSKLNWSGSVSASWANDDYMQGHFGITSAQSAATGLAEFEGEAGVKDVGIQLEASYVLSRRWQLAAQLGTWRLLRVASDSPLVQTGGGINQSRAMVGVLYELF